MIAYFDSSSIAKWFFDEPGMEFSRQVRNTSEISITSPLSFPEVISAIYRAAQDKRCSKKDGKLVKEELLSTWPHFQLIQMNDLLIQTAGKLVYQYGLKGSDAVHLASALMLKGGEVKVKIFFSCFDAKLNRAAKKEGFMVHQISSF